MRNSNSLSPAHQPQGFLEWFHRLRAITDEDLKIAGGADAALYVMFNRQATIFFALMSIFNSIILIPIYATG